MKIKFNKQTDKDLLEVYAELMEEMRIRKLIRSNNNPVSDYAEKLVIEKFGLELCSKSTTGYDAINTKTKVKFQIKARRLTKHNKSRQLGVIRNIDEKLFDFLIVILFDDLFNVVEAYKVPFPVVFKTAKEHGRWNDQQHGYILHADNKLTSKAKVIDITSKFK